MKIIKSGILAVLLLLFTNTGIGNAEEYQGGGFSENEIIKEGSNEIISDLEVEDRPNNLSSPDAAISLGPPSCNRTHSHNVATVTMQVKNLTGSYRSLMWGFHLTSSARSFLGPIVVVKMPSAAVNGKAINTPYEPHSEGASYNFHGSMKNYQIKGQSYPLKKGDIVNLSWHITGTNPERYGYRYLTCKMP
ncbi:MULTISPECIES: hypothetical protein [Niallia]|uniref:Uncharacterized protein n=1 Tax=Niallia circulans TaxID=1397 RepID=A0A268F5T4_NIACI|nr:hypothetical protein [Niallia circulans]AYV66947.1 hypothetical protein C2I06_08700 [Niallia circulans]AYV70188.1 hypothetical protein C2H98_00620 [Niallia circulans]PAD80714.1 hypothetical protein CHH57_23485 [Niallia circulans]QJX62840.1 hypothetical protein HLK66_15045 [Niallia circulans]